MHVTLADMCQFERAPNCNIVAFYRQHGHSDFRIFTTGRKIGGKTVFILLHNDHYYGIKNLKGVFRMPISVWIVFYQLQVVAQALMLWAQDALVLSVAIQTVDNNLQISSTVMTGTKHAIRLVIKKAQWIKTG